MIDVSVLWRSDCSNKTVSPFTGNGFTKATNGQIIPEYKMFDFVKIEDGAQIIEIGKDGKETLKAIYDVDFGRFIPIE